MTGTKQSGTEVGLREIVDIHRKITHVLTKIGVELDVFITNLANDHYKKAKRTPSSWFNKSAPKNIADEAPVISHLRYRGCEEIIKTLYQKHKIVFRDEWFKLSFKEFCDIYDRPTIPATRITYVTPESSNINKDRVARVSSIVGVYQVIRPYMMDTSRYIAEAMAIKHNDLDYCEMLMYSHNVSDSEYMYSGTLIIDNRYCFALIRRMHEVYNDRMVNRSVLLHVDFEKRRGFYVTRPVYSGIILRGLKGKEGKKAAAIPFIAIKTNHDISVMKDASFHEGNVNGIKQITKCLLIGEISKNQNNIFSLCDRIFEAMKRYSLKDYEILTIDPITAESLIKDNPRDKIGCYGAWERVVSQDLAESI